MIGVHLKDVEIFANHGVYPQEAVCGGLFTIQLSVYYYPSTTEHTLENGIDYTQLYTIVQQRMQKATGLLENIAEDICAQIKESYPFVCRIELLITKNKPPVSGFKGKTAVSIVKEWPVVS